MVEELARVLYYFGVHLLYASVVWVAAWVLTSIPSGSAGTKYWIWLASSLNFILPLGALFDKLLAPHLTFAKPLAFIGDAGLRIAENHGAALAMGSVWMLGATLMGLRLSLRLRHERRDSCPGTDIGEIRAFVAQGIAVTLGTSHTPAVNGILRPTISLPRGIYDLLSENELNAVLLHELTHAKRRDNLIRLVHEIIVCVLWFHPMVWITSARISFYRELSCDESVIQHAHAGDLVSALSKLASRESPLLLQATASSFLSARLARLVADQPQRRWGLANAMLAAVFGAALTGGVLSTVAHTACCFVHKR